MSQEKKKDELTEQLFNILQELGPVDYEYLQTELFQLMRLEFPTKEYVDGIKAVYSGTWEQFASVWKAFHIFRIAKKWRKLKKIAEKYPNFDTELFDVANERKSQQD